MCSSQFGGQDGIAMRMGMTQGQQQAAGIWPDSKPPAAAPPAPPPQGTPVYGGGPPSSDPSSPTNPLAIPTVGGSASPAGTPQLGGVGAGGSGLSIPTA